MLNNTLFYIHKLMYKKFQNKKILAKLLFNVTFKKFKLKKLRINKYQFNYLSKLDENEK